MSWQEKVKLIMKHQGINQKKLSMLSGVPEPCISRYLKGEREARIDVIFNFAKSLDVKPEFLLGLDEYIIDPYADIATAINRSAGDLTSEEKNRLIALLLSVEE